MHLVKDRLITGAYHFGIDAEDAALRRRNVIHEYRTPFFPLEIELLQRLRDALGFRAHHAHITRGPFRGERGFARRHFVGGVVIVSALHSVSRAGSRGSRCNDAALVRQPPRQYAMLALQPIALGLILALLGLPTALRFTIRTAPQTRRASIDAHRV